MTHSEDHLVIVDKLTYAGHFVNIQDVLEGSQATFIQEDIANRVAMERVFHDYCPQAILNFAAESHVDRSIDSPYPFINTNIVGTFVLLETARKFVSALPEGSQRDFRFLHVSTDEVYGSLEETGQFSEETPYAPNSPYAASKAGADHLVRAYYHTYGLPTLITNCSNNYGPYQFPEKLIPLMLLNALDGKTLPIYGNGQHIRDWLYVEDHCAGLWRVLHQGRPGEKYNFGGDSERTNIETVEAVCRILETFRPAAKNKKLVEQGVTHYSQLKRFVSDRPGHDRRYAINADKIQKELGWTPQSNFEEGLEKTICWYLEHPDWCDAVMSDNYDRERLGLGVHER
jgi:dTDP-glucose 4,6-dehydratase